MLLHIVVIVMFVGIRGKVGMVIRVDKGRGGGGSVLVERIIIVDKAD